jgi:transposase
MPWKASSVMEERLRFVARLLDGEAMTDVCRDFGISRKTGYKIFDRYKEHGLAALSDRSRRPVRYGNAHHNCSRHRPVGLWPNCS